MQLENFLLGGTLGLSLLYINNVDAKEPSAYPSPQALQVQTNQQQPNFVVTYTRTRELKILRVYPLPFDTSDSFIDAAALRVEESVSITPVE